jgi:hypothetical protein
MIAQKNNHPQAGPTFINDFDIGGNPNCGVDSSHPCLYWQEPNYTSITVGGFFGSSLNLGYYDFAPRVTAAINDYNAAPAYNPYMNGTCTPSCSAAFWGAVMGCLVYGGTNWSGRGPVQYGNLGGGYGDGYYQFITFSNVYFNSDSRAQWNDSLNWAADPPNCTFNADGRKVAHHELGHVQALGHTAIDPAIMRQGPVNYYTLQTNDIQGLQGIYTGDQPSS